MSELEVEPLSDFDVVEESDFVSDLLSDFESADALTSLFLSEEPDEAGAEPLRA